jgi:hypothetical protein
MGEAAGGQAEEQAAAPSWPLVQQLAAPSQLAKEWAVAPRRHAGEHDVQCTVAGRAIRCKRWRNRGLPAEAASTSAAAADIGEK